MKREFDAASEVLLGQCSNSPGLCAVRRRPLLSGIVAASLIVTTGCTNLKPVADFASKASVVTSYPGVAKDYPLILARLKLCGERGSAVSDEKAAERLRDSKRLLEAQTVLQAYAKALGELAADDLPNYDHQIDALNQSLVDGKFAAASDTGNYAQAAKFGLGIFTDLYRRGKIQKLITTYNPSIQKAVAQLLQVVDGYLVSLSDEQIVYNQLVAGRSRKAAEFLKLEGFPEFVSVAAADHAQLLLDREANARALSRGIKAFGQGHQELADNIGTASFKKILANATKYAEQLQTVIESFNR